MVRQAGSPFIERAAMISNAISVDVEDYYQVEAFSNIISRNEWDEYPSRVEKNTEKILEIFSDYGVHGTFFILGCVAEKHKSLVMKINSEGHEVACHGYSHKMITKQSKDEFINETKKAKLILEDISGAEVKGYRAATYSITSESLWALEELSRIGFKYDSSIFPIKHDRYGIESFSREPCTVATKFGNIVEYPISTTKVLNNNFPVAGGGYFRLYPYLITKLGLLSINKEELPFVFYLHPWEIDPDQPRINDVNALTRFRHYINLNKTETKLRKLLSDFRFKRIDEVIEGKKYPVVNV